MATVRDFFAREAGEYLDALERITEGMDSGAIAPAELHRVSRALRGSAQMAREDSIAQVATALEGVARVVADGHVRWTSDLAGRVRDTARDLRSLLAGDAAAPAIVSSAVSRLAGIAAAPARPAPAGPSNA